MFTVILNKATEKNHALLSVSFSILQIFALTNNWFAKNTNCERAMQVRL